MTKVLDALRALESDLLRRADVEWNEAGRFIGHDDASDAFHQGRAKAFLMVAADVRRLADDAIRGEL